jgi:hypothetical protein
MSSGLCDVNGCTSRVLLGWRPLTECQGRKICEQHWRRHQDEKDRFDLYVEFKFRMPKGVRKPAAKKHIPRCTCGRALSVGHRFCAICAKERERQRKKRAYHERKNQKREPIVQENILLCKACGGNRKSGCTYCPKCSRERQRQANRERQRRYYRKMAKCGGLT